MLLAYRMRLPAVHWDTFIADSAQVIGKVEVDQGTSVWFNAVIRGDVNTITVGAHCNIQDSAVLHVTAQDPLRIGSYVTVGHNAILHGCTVEDGALIGMGAIVLDGAVVGEGALIAAGSLVPPGKKVPSHTLVMGSPAKVVRELSPEEVAGLKNQAVHYEKLWREGYK